MISKSDFEDISDKGSDECESQHSRENISQCSQECEIRIGRNDQAREHCEIEMNNFENQVEPQQGSTNFRSQAGILSKGSHIFINQIEEENKKLRKIIKRSSSAPQLSQNKKNLLVNESSEPKDIYGPWEEVSEFSDLSESENSKQSGVILNEEQQNLVKL